MSDTLHSRASRYRRASVSGLLILVLGYLVFISGRQALSDFYTLLAQQEFEQGAGTLKKDQDGSWQRSMGYLTEARRHSPDNAWPLGVTSDLRIRRMRAATDRKQAFGEAFTVQFDLRAYLRQNPTSPHA